MNANSESAHLSIGDVLNHLSAEFPDVTISKIRFLESQGLIAPERTPSGYRKFYESDLLRLRWILLQQKDNFLPLKVIKDRLQEHDLDGSPLPDTSDELHSDSTVATFFDAVPEESGPVAIPEENSPPVEAPAKKKRRKAVPKKVEAPMDEKSSRTTRLRGEQMELDSQGDVLTSEPEGNGLTRSEIADASGLTIDQVVEMEACGLIKAAGQMGPEGLFEDDALIIASLVAGFIENGAEPRHLRMYRNFAEREAQFYEQMVAGRQRPNGAESLIARRDKVVELASLGRSLRTVYLRRSLDQILRTSQVQEDGFSGSEKTHAP